MANFSVIGSGGWGTAFSCLLAGKNHDVLLWCQKPETAVILAEKRINSRQLPGVKIPDSIQITEDPAKALKHENWIIAVPTAYMRETLTRIVPHIHDANCKLNIISLTKGIEKESFKRPSEIIGELLRPLNLAVLSGPNHAEEISKNMPASAVVAARDVAFASWCQENCGNERFRLYTNPDLVGVELAGALKNVIGIAAGMCDGLGMGDNAKSALMTRGLAEMTRFAVAYGANPSTLTGLAGMGDLTATCFSLHGRNRNVGEKLAKGLTLADVTNGPQVAEGVYTAKSVHEIAQSKKLDLPIMSAVYRVIYENKPVKKAMEELLGRRLKGEEQW